MTSLEPPSEPPVGTGTERALGVPGGRRAERGGDGRRVGASGDFVMDADWLAPHPDPSTPVFRPPAGAVDAHCHVFGPGEVFPYAPERKYTPCDAPKEALGALHERLGLDRAVIVQATCHGADNRALVDALEAAGDRARGVATVRADVADAELDALHRAGVRGARFNFVRRLVDAPPTDALEALAPRLAERGWHAVVYFEAKDLAELEAPIARQPCPVVIDHMGRPNVTEPVDGPGFSRLLRLMEERERLWCKVSCPERLSLVGPPDYDDVLPFSRRLVERFPDRVLWGTDWPHPNMRSHVPDDGALVDLVPRIAPTPRAQRALLVDNPERLYWRD